LRGKVQVKTIIGRGHSSNVFLVKSNRNFLVDAGMGVAEKVKDLVKDTDLDRIILTHRHIDHVGDAELLSKELDVPLYAPKKEAEALRKGDDHTILSNSFGKKISPLDVKTLDIGTFSGFEIILTPGHTEESICLYHQDENILISGDTVFANGGAGRTDLPTGDRKELVESLEMLAELDVDSLYPGHMSTVEKDAGDHIKKSLRYIKMF